VFKLFTSIVILLLTIGSLLLLQERKTFDVSVRALLNMAEHRPYLISSVEWYSIESVVHGKESRTSIQPITARKIIGSPWTRHVTKAITTSH